MPTSQFVTLDVEGGIADVVAGDVDDADGIGTFVASMSLSFCVDIPDPEDGKPKLPGT